MEIISYNAIQLQEFIDSDFYKNLKQIPISEHRAVAHIHNPDVSEEDILLWAAYENEQLAGYVGVLPGFANINQERKKIFWLSCFWVDEKLRNSNVASMLFFPVIKRYGAQLVISNFLPKLEKMYQGINIFKPTIYKSGSRFYCKSCLGDVLPARFPVTRFVKPLLKGFDFLANLFLDCRKLFYKPLNFNSKIISGTNFDADFQNFIHSFYNNNNYVERFSEHFDWILKYPWILQGKPDKESARYYFSSKSEQFYFDSVKFFRNNKLCAFLLLKIRDKKLTLSYVFAEDELVDDISAYILQKVSDEKLFLITVFDERILNKIRTNRIRYIFERSCKRACIFPKTLEFHPVLLQEGDGDHVFT